MHTCVSVFEHSILLQKNIFSFPATLFLFAQNENITKCIQGYLASDFVCFPSLFLHKIDLKLQLLLFLWLNYNLHQFLFRLCIKWIKTTFSGFVCTREVASYSILIISSSSISIHDDCDNCSPSLTSKSTPNWKLLAFTFNKWSFFLIS